jgi:hypothetical protein
MSVLAHTQLWAAMIMDSEAITTRTGSTFSYNYRELPALLRRQIAAYFQRTRELFDPIARSFADHSNTERFIRGYPIGFVPPC